MLFLRKHRTVCLVAAAALLAAFAQAADWPGYRHDVARSGVTDEQLRMPLHLQWTYVPSHPPQPAWPEPGKMLHRMPFDYAYQVAVASGMVYFGSSADCKVYALDAATGEERWSVFTDAPVRFAPTVADGRLFVASDDGWLYCLSPFDGRVLWQFRAAPRDDMLLGNGRMISRWPLRTGTLVRDGVVYVTAGMWPTEGIYVYALRADDGTVIWKNDTSGAMYMRLPHPGAEAITGVAPQGYLLASDDVLLVPTGRSLLAGFDRATGRFLHYRPAENLRDGGAWATAFADWVFCGRHPGGPDIDVRLGEADPARGDGLAAWECRTGNRRLDIVGKHRLVIRDGTLYASGSGSLSAYDFDAIRRGKKPGDCVKWQAPCERTYALILAGNTLFAGGRGKVTAYDASDGSVVWAHTVEDQARGLAVADGRLYVSMKNGRIACFAARQVASPRTVSPNRTVSPYDDDALASAYAELAERIIAESGATEGYCLDFGAGKGRLAYELAKRTNLNIYCIEPDARSVRAAREALDAAGLYGVRVTVHQGRLDRLPYSSYFANLIVSDTGCAGHLQKRVGAELYRALRPSGGVVYLARPPGANGPSPARLARWLREAGVPDEEMRVAEGAVRIVRGPLPGAGDWTHQYADIGKSGCASDRLVKWPMQVLWFGGPGPARMMSRHWKTAAPVSTNGRLFVAGQNSVIATDAYNGRELWTFDLPNIGIRGVQGRGSNIAADEDTVYVATGSVCFAIDAGTGEQERIYRFPTRAERYALDRPQSFAVGPAQAPLGTVTIRSAAEGLELRLVSKDRKVTNAHRTDRPQLGDSWELFFDFRPREKRGARYEPGAFQVIVVPPTVQEPRASWHPGAGVSHPRLTVSGTLSDDGSETTVRLSWQEVAGLVGGQPPDFSFGVTLNSSDDGEKIAQKTYLFTSPDSRRLTAGWATFVRDARRGEQEPEAELLPPEVERSRIWGYLGVWGDLVFGSVGTANEGEYVFALGKGDGRLRWMYRAQEAIPNNAIAVGDDRMFLIDRTSQAKVEQMKRRGQPVVSKASLVALDATSGEVLWRTDRDIGGLSELWFSDHIVLASNRAAMTAYSSRDGSVLWSRRVRSQRFPVIVGDTIYAQPMAYDLKTGAPKGRSDPLTGQETPWTFVRAYGCGAVSAAPNLLLFRSGTFGFYDLAGDSGIHNFGGIRPGCFVNMIAASGLVLIPEGSSACTCAYNFQTSVALAPTRKQEDWGVFSGVMPSGRVRRLAVNLGAPGDKRDEDGTMWLGFPRPSFHAAVRVPLVTDIRSEPRYYRRNADEVVVKRTTRPWLYASGATDVRSIVTSLMIPRRVAAVPCPQPPKIDGTLDDSCWDEEAALTLTDDAQNLDRSARAFLCQDDDNLYVAFDRRGVEGAGEPLKLTMRTGGEDAPVWNDDSWEVFLSDARRAGYVQLGASASGARFDGAYKYASDKSVNPGWNGQWTCAKSVRPDGWTLEMAIPWATLADAGLARDRLTINIRGHNRTGTGPAVVRLTDPGSRGFGRCERFVPVVVGRPEPSEPHRYTVRLHFAEPGGAKPGQRVFDVRLQGKTVLRGFDIVTEAGGPGAALVKEFDGVRASGTMQIDFVPKTEAPSLARAPIISAVELIAEEGS